MPHANSPTTRQLSSYEVLGLRIQAVVNSPRAQAAKAVVLEPSANDDPADWERILDEIAENENVTVARRDDGAVQLTWTVPRDE
ncbi:DUF1654 domain-containing protein [Pseudomonas sp. DTU_2021_1001937_2_SI_NGA_ILE_001]|uniref:DUF1654 domain-containing protein n=1 Tax=Pseudomonas sp. DTU_2021_1001937_2_SI_NGA_ILE_001 TaxID=3077589 RepID=UPI0028FC228A|nr:DUF1654 domain-containing protein [Pseudomonas sp. DTU_2021_1001937_2_SI_NGA_ILE_001]WNW10105.1 DUF1654 domain-containing protein [Pseudomonas sp. DTU_2021_1001937_2_SI_NGA_ILE_001]